MFMSLCLWFAIQKPYAYIPLLGTIRAMSNTYVPGIIGEVVPGTWYLIRVSDQQVIVVVSPTV